MSAIKSIAIAGFRSFGASVEVPLKPLNLLIGANGSGKSNFLAAFAFLQAFHSRRIVEYVERAGGADQVLHFGSRHTRKISIRIEFDDDDGYSLEFHRDARDQLYVPEEDRYAKNYIWLGTQRIPDMGDRRRNTIDRLAAWRHYHFHDTSQESPMKRTSKLGDNRSFREDGSNLASILYLLRQQYGVSYNAIRRTVQRVAPFFDDFVLEPWALNRNMIRLEWRHRGQDAYFDASSLSDGTLRFIALATLLLQPRELRPNVTLLDEPELGLHPYAIAMLAAMVRSASHESQVVLATQSPILVDHFEPEDVLVAERVASATRVRRLEWESLRTWLEEYSLGQLWEKNQLGGRPARESPEHG